MFRYKWRKKELHTVSISIHLQRCQKNFITEVFPSRWLRVVPATASWRTDWIESIVKNAIVQRCRSLYKQNRKEKISKIIFSVELDIYKNLTI